MQWRVTMGLALAALVALPALAVGQTCPEPLRGARRLVLVTAPTMAATAATLQLFARGSPAMPWRPVSVPERALLGRAGMAWGYRFRGLARRGEPIKTEGDKRAPAGVYAIGRSFGFAALRRRGYLRLTEDTVCVDDPSSPAYNTIASRSTIGPHVHAEHMRRASLYRHGLLVDYPTSRAARAGSCVFIHVWLSPNYGTSGCVALPEARVEALQDFAAGGAVLAVLPKPALPRFAGCLPVN